MTFWCARNFARNSFLLLFVFNISSNAFGLWCNILLEIYGQLYYFIVAQLHFLLVSTTGYTIAAYMIFFMISDLLKTPRAICALSFPIFHPMLSDVKATLLYQMVVLQGWLQVDLCNSDGGEGGGGWAWSGSRPAWPYSVFAFAYAYATVYAYSFIVYACI